MKKHSRKVYGFEKVYHLVNAQNNQIKISDFATIKINVILKHLKEFVMKQWFCTTFQMEKLHKKLCKVTSKHY